MAGGKKKPNRRPQPKPRPKPAGGAGPAPPAKPTQAARFAAARQARVRKSRNLRVALAGVAVVVIAAVAWRVIDGRRDAAALRAELQAGDCTFDTRRDRTDPANPHSPPAAYEIDPPAGGNHAPGPADAGTYTADNRPSDAQVVHSLEHGYVAVWHRPALDEEAMAAVRNAVQAYQRDVLVLPRDSLTVDVAATAWGERLLCPAVETGPLQRFVEAYRNKGPERVDHPPV